jgi:hypothetical protein
MSHNEVAEETENKLLKLDGIAFSVARSTGALEW